jgi:MarR-like DNA-binding transcriptional regulator SgrR of sgrS sRNA
MLAPADGWLLVAHARFELARRDGVRALVVAQRLSGLYPEAALGHTLAGTAFLLQERPAEARGAFQQALAARWEPDAATQRTAVEALVKRLPAGVPATPAAQSRRTRRPHR